MPSWTPDISPGRREAIGRAARAMIRLAFIPELRAETHHQLGVVAAVTAYDDHDAATAVAALEHMLIDRGLMTPEQVEADILAHRTTRGASAAVNSETTVPPGLQPVRQAGGDGINTATGLPAGGRDERNRRTADQTSVDHTDRRDRARATAVRRTRHLRDQLLSNDQLNIADQAALCATRDTIGEQPL